ncbi:MAG: hypothetical protein JOY51_03385, partial [Nevskia sp.]|nr:hypothetical protein [Nevskia sp.]
GQADAAARALHSATVMRQRAHELGARQDAVAALWLGAADTGGAELGTLVADCLHLLRGRLSAQQVRLHATGLDALGAARLPRGASAARIALLALLLAAGAGAHDSGAAAVTVRGSVADGAALLEVQAPLQTQALACELGGTGEDLIAALALLLEPCGLRLEVSAEPALSRLSLAL